VRSKKAAEQAETTPGQQQRPDGERAFSAVAEAVRHT
jgi:hypothetical protein